MNIRSRRGLTLVELIVAVTLTAVIIGGACSAFYLVSSSYQNGTLSASSQQKALLVENYLRKYAATAYSLSDSTQADKDGVTFAIANDTLTITEHTASSSKDKVIATVDGIQKIEFRADSSNYLNYTIKFPDTTYTFQGGIVMNNGSGNELTGAVENSNKLFLGKSR